MKKYIQVIFVFIMGIQLNAQTVNELIEEAPLLIEGSLMYTLEYTEEQRTVIQIPEGEGYKEVVDVEPAFYSLKLSISIEDFDVFQKYSEQNWIDLLNDDRTVVNTNYILYYLYNDKLPSENIDVKDYAYWETRVRIMVKDFQVLNGLVKN